MEYYRNSPVMSMEEKHPGSDACLSAGWLSITQCTGRESYSSYSLCTVNRSVWVILELVLWPLHSAPRVCTTYVLGLLAQVSSLGIREWCSAEVSSADEGNGES